MYVNTDRSNLKTQTYFFNLNNVPKICQPVSYKHYKQLKRGGWPARTHTHTLGRFYTRSTMYFFSHTHRE